VTEENGKKVTQGGFGRKGTVGRREAMTPGETRTGLGKIRGEGVG